VINQTGRASINITDANPNWKEIVDIACGLYWQQRVTDSLGDLYDPTKVYLLVLRENS
jgi:hypothetical protein